MKKADTGKVKVVRDDALIVAVDIGMEMNRGYCTTPDGRSTKIFKFENTREGLDALWGRKEPILSQKEINDSVIRTLATCVQRSGTIISHLDSWMNGS
jgi:hypothetical protein